MRGEGVAAYPNFLTTPLTITTGVSEHCYATSAAHVPQNLTVVEGAENVIHTALSRWRLAGCAFYLFIYSRAVIGLLKAVD